MTSGEKNTDSAASSPMAEDVAPATKSDRKPSFTPTDTGPTPAAAAETASAPTPRARYAFRGWTVTALKFLALKFLVLGDRQLLGFVLFGGRGTVLGDWLLDAAQIHAVGVVDRADLGADAVGVLCCSFRFFRVSRRGSGGRCRLGVA